jgi:hypothetical protein
LKCKPFLKLRSKKSHQALFYPFWQIFHFWCTTKRSTVGTSGSLSIGRNCEGLQHCCLFQNLKTYSIIIVICVTFLLKTNIFNFAAASIKFASALHPGGNYKVKWLYIIIFHPREPVIL